MRFGAVASLAERNEAGYVHNGVWGKMVELQAVEVQDAAKEDSLAGVDRFAILGQAAAATDSGAAVLRRCAGAVER